MKISLQLTSAHEVFERRVLATFHSAAVVYAMFQRDPRAGAFLGGDRVSGQDVRDQNGEICAKGAVDSGLTRARSGQSWLHRRSQTSSKAR